MFFRPFPFMEYALSQIAYFTCILYQIAQGIKRISAEKIKIFKNFEPNGQKNVYA